MVSHAPIDPSAALSVPPMMSNSGATAALALTLGATVLMGCGGTRDRTPEGPAAPAEPEGAEAQVPVYDLHEWGLVSAGPNAFEVAAGPGQRAAALAVDKPVLYVHPTEAEPFELTIRVDLGSGLSVAEHFPPAPSLAPITWRARVDGQCRGSYPVVDDSHCPDGYCELGELHLYETTDAACLQVGTVRAPLLFYRLRATGLPPELPIEIISTDRGARTGRNRGIDRQVGGAWRVTWDGTATRVSPVAIPGVGQTFELPTATGSDAAARQGLRADLSDLGLTSQEAGVFMNAWEEALFGLATTVDGIPAVDRPVDRVNVSDEELLPTDEPVSPAPRARDALLYWLPSTAIDALARVTASPSPRSFNRAFLVRQAL